MRKGNGYHPIAEVLRRQAAEKTLRPFEAPNPILEEDVRFDKPPFNVTFDLDGRTIGRFFYEDRQLKFEGDVDESAEIWINWVIKKFMEWHDEKFR